MGLCVSNKLLNVDDVFHHKYSHKNLTKLFIYHLFIYSIIFVVLSIEPNHTCSVKLLRGKLSGSKAEVRTGIFLSEISHPSSWRLEFPAAAAVGCGTASVLPLHHGWGGRHCRATFLVSFSLPAEEKRFCKSEGKKDPT